MTFFYHSEPVRVVYGGDGNPWWVAKDVCAALDLTDTSKSCSKLDDDEKGTKIILTLGGPQAHVIINEPGLYSLILRSSKPEARRFKRWITHDVLPAIRRTGRYVHPQSPSPSDGPGGAQPHVSWAKLAREFEGALRVSRMAGEELSRARTLANAAVLDRCGVDCFAALGIEVPVETDDLGDFAAACLVLGSGFSASPASVYTAYCKWCGAHGRPALGRNHFYESLTARFPQVTRRQHGMSRRHTFLGVRVK
jgi:hypothetical protein